MNYRMVLNTLGKVVYAEAAFLILPLVTAFTYREGCLDAIAVTVAIAVILGFILTKIKPKNEVLFAKEGLVIAALTWILMSAIGALPFVISGEIPSYVDAFFETVSGFTTTGASILTDVEAMSHGLLMWRSFTHWIGGMGVLVFIVAITSKAPDRSIHILRAEMPGPTVDKLVPRSRDTAKLLYSMYLAMTAVQVVLLLCGGMPLFDSIVHTFGTAGTGGFGIKADSIAGYNSYLQWVITIFMLLFGVNFNIYYLVIAGRIKDALKSTELRVYLAIVLCASAIIFANTVSTDTFINSISEAVRTSVFQISSIITTTGYATADFNLWPSLSKGVLLILMVIGGCAGSTAGGIKVSRAIILFKEAKNELKRVLHPRTVGVVKLDGKKLDSTVLSGVSTYLTLYVFSFIAVLLLVSIDGYDFETNFSAATACFNNVGPGLSLVGPASNYSCYTPFAKIVLSVAMLLGRLEIYPILLTLSFSTWVKDK